MGQFVVTDVGEPPLFFVWVVFVQGLQDLLMIIDQFEGVVEDLQFVIDLIVGRPYFTEILLIWNS